MELLNKLISWLNVCNVTKQGIKASCGWTLLHCKLPKVMWPFPFNWRINVIFWWLIRYLIRCGPTKCGLLVRIFLNFCLFHLTVCCLKCPKTESFSRCITHLVFSFSRRLLLFLSNESLISNLHNWCITKQFDTCTCRLNLKMT